VFLLIPKISLLPSMTTTTAQHDDDCSKVNTVLLLCSESFSENAVFLFCFCFFLFTTTDTGISCNFFSFYFFSFSIFLPCPSSPHSLTHLRTQVIFVFVTACQLCVYSYNSYYFTHLPPTAPSFFSCFKSTPIRPFQNHNSRISSSCLQQWQRSVQCRLRNCPRRRRI
jgi:hypothetical protein